MLKIIHGLAGYLVVVRSILNIGPFQRKVVIKLTIIYSPTGLFTFSAGIHKPRNMVVSYYVRHYLLNKKSQDYLYAILPMLMPSSDICTYPVLERYPNHYNHCKWHADDLEFPRQLKLRSSLLPLRPKIAESIDIFCIFWVLIVNDKKHTA